MVLAAGKRGHYYLTARALRTEGVLRRFVTGLFFDAGTPWRRGRSRSDALLRGAPVVSLWPVEGAYRALCAAVGRRRALMRAYNAAFDVLTIPFLRGGDTFHVASTYALRSGPAARRMGMRVVLDQQSVHPLYRREAVHHAYSRLRSPEPPSDPATDARIAKELEQADLILAPSRFVFEQNVRAGIPAERQRVVALGVDTDVFRPVPRVRQPGEPLRVLLAGGIAPAKGVVDLLEAARRVGGRVRVTLAGRIAPGMQEHLAPYAHLFDHRPPMPQDELLRLYHCADVFCLPSYFEGSALVVSEAMACGLPCVVTEAAGSPIEHGRDGWIVPAGAPAELADALEALDDASLRARLGAAARRAAEANDLASYGRRLVAAYDGPADARDAHAARA